MEKATKQQTEIKFWVFETQQINKDTKFEPLDDQHPTPTVSYVVFVRHAMPWSGRWLLVERPDACYVLGRKECGAQIIKFFIFIILFEKKLSFAKINVQVKMLQVYTYYYATGWLCRM